MNNISDQYVPDRGGLKWPPLIQGVLIRRYKRFLADVRLRNGHLVTAYCSNTGSMRACSEPGRPVYLSRSKNPKRRLRYTWEMISMSSSKVGVNTQVPNQLVKTAIIHNRIKPLKNYDHVQTEITVSRRSRLDLLAEKKGTDKDRCFIEVKNCALVEKDTAYFPDAVTVRGRKHLAELEKQVGDGSRGIIFYLVQRMDATVFKPADHIDPDYGRALRKAVHAGVEIMVYDVKIDPKRIDLNQPIPYEL